MTISLEKLLTLLKSNPDNINFQDVMSVIDQHYHYTTSAFRNGLEQDLIYNQAGENEGSCKIFAFGQLHQLTEDQALACFGTYYRQDVLQHPHGVNHQNIRSFMRHGWKGIQFKAPALTAKS